MKFVKIIVWSFSTLITNWRTQR